MVQLTQVKLYSILYYYSLDISEQFIKHQSYLLHGKVREILDFYLYWELNSGLIKNPLHWRSQHNNYHWQKLPIVYYCFCFFPYFRPDEHEGDEENKKPKGVRSVSNYFPSKPEDNRKRKHAYFRERCLKNIASF